MAGDELKGWLGNCESDLWWPELGQDTSRGGALQCLPLNELNDSNSVVNKDGRSCHSSLLDEEI